MHIYSSILDPYEPPRPARIYDNPQVVRRSLLSQLFAGFRTAAVTPPTVSTAGRPGQVRTRVRAQLSEAIWRQALLTNANQLRESPVAKEHASRSRKRTFRRTHVDLTAGITAPVGFYIEKTAGTSSGWSRSVRESLAGSRARVRSCASALARGTTRVGAGEAGTQGWCKRSWSSTLGTHVSRGSRGHVVSTRDPRCRSVANAVTSIAWRSFR